MQETPESPVTEETSVTGDFRTDDDVSARKSKKREPIDFTDSINELKARRAEQVKTQPLHLTSEEETESLICTIGGEDYRLSSILEWNFDQDEAALALIPDLMPMVEKGVELYNRVTYYRTHSTVTEELAKNHRIRVEEERILAELEGRDPIEIPATVNPMEDPQGITSEEIKQFVVDTVRCIVEAKAHRRLLAVTYVPVDEPHFNRDRMDEIMEKMGKATNNDLFRAIARFFTIGNG